MENWDPDLEFLDWMYKSLDLIGALDNPTPAKFRKLSHRELIEGMRAGDEEFFREMYRWMVASPSYNGFLRWRGRKDRDEETIP